MRRLVLAVALALPLLPPLPAGAQDRPELIEIRFEGNEAFPDDSLARAIVNRETHCRSFFFEILLLCPLGLDFAFEHHDLNRRELPRDVARLRLYYYQRGYREAQVDTSLAYDEPDDEVDLTFLIEEGRPVLVQWVRVVGGEELHDPGLLGDLPLEEGRPLSGILLDATRDTLLRRLRNTGYAHADVLRNFFIPADSPYSARVTFDVAPGTRARFGEIHVIGNEELSERVVRRMLPFGEGDLYSQAAIFQGQRNLFALDLIQNANITDSLEHEPDSVVPVTVAVSEGDVHRVRTGVGWSTAECMNADARWTSRNFFGGARRLQVRGRVSNVLANTTSSLCPQAGTGIYGQLNWLAAVDFNQPWIFSPRNSLTAGLYAERASLPDVFVRRALGGNLALVRSIGTNTALTLFYRPQLQELRAAEIYFCTSFLVCDPADIDELQRANWLSPVGVGATRDMTDNILDPTRGYSLSGEVEYASIVTGSNYGYLRGVGEGRYYHPLGGDRVVAARLRAGWVGNEEFGDLQGSEIVHPFKRFYAGGANSVRGYPQNRLGPKVLTVDVRRLLLPPAEGESPFCTPQEVMARTCDASPLEDQDFLPRPTGGSVVVEGNVEMRFPLLGRNFGGAAFVDFGQVWADPGDIGLGDVAVTPGVGIRYDSPIGPIRVDVAYRLGGGELLQVVTSQVRPFIPGEDDPSRCLLSESPNGDVQCVFPWVRTEELALFEPRVLFNEGGAFALNRFQIHLSIGQAF